MLYYLTNNPLSQDHWEAIASAIPAYVILLISAFLGLLVLLVVQCVFENLLPDLLVIHSGSTIFVGFNLGKLRNHNPVF